MTKMKNLFNIKIKFEGKNVHSINADDEKEAREKLRGFFGKFE